MDSERIRAPFGTSRSARLLAGLRLRPLTPAEARVGAAHLVALLATVSVLAASLQGSGQRDEALVGIAIFAGISTLRVASVGRRLAISTLALDAVGTAVLLAGTDAPASPHYFLAMAGAWWAAHIPRARSGLVWAAAFGLAYGALVLLPAFGDGALVQALEDASAVVIIGLLSDWFVRVDRRALELSETLARVPAGAEKVAIRDGLKRALGPVEISIDVLLAAAQSGLTVIQAELLAYLVMGLTNQEIADATSVSEATVRYRLTRLYRALGVRDRKGARRRALDLGLASSLEAPPSRT